MTEAIQGSLIASELLELGDLNFESPMNNEDFGCRLVLSQLVEPGDPHVGRAVQERGAPKVLTHFRLLEDDGSAVWGLRHLKLPSRWNTERAIELAKRELEAAMCLGIEFVAPFTPGWPTQLRDLGAREPLLLRVRGQSHMRALAARGIGMVGARACTRYGQEMTEDLAARLASNDWTVISGGAYGIDAAAHRGALAAGGATIAVSAAGVDQAVPASNSALFEAVSQSGAVVSEAPIGAHPTRSRFLVRNRLIAALSRAVVVTEAALRSGSLSTAREASEIGRILMAVPGPVTSLSSAGGHKLIQDGLANLVTNHTDVLQLMKVMGGDLEVELSTDLDQYLLQTLGAECPDSITQAFEIDQVAELLDLSVAEVLVGLCSLEHRQLVDRTPLGWTIVPKRSTTRQRK